MNTPIIIVILSFIGYLIAYQTYGKFLGQKIFALTNQNRVPSIEHSDNSDYVASSKIVTFGHHFTSIAGTGPIVGPAIGIIWGWVPALIWIFFGSIFMGAVHDFSILVISMRNQGRSIADITGDIINKRVKYLFFIVIFLALLIVIAIFGLIIALIFARFPESVLAVWLEIPIAIVFGVTILKKHKYIALGTIVAVGLLYGTVYIGYLFPFTLPNVGIPATGAWTIILLTYAFFASVLPVNWLLQPRDYINAWQLFVALGLIVCGIMVVAVNQPFEFVAPAIHVNPLGAPPMLPFLFITIACGAISGFHCLVSSGTTSKQIAAESDARLVGFGSMLTEGFLAILVVVAVGAGLGLSYQTDTGFLTGSAAFQVHYQSWEASTGLGSKLTAVVVGTANILGGLGIPFGIATAIMGVFIASFAGTTLDSSTRVQRYIISELAQTMKLPYVANKWVATGIAVISAACLAFSSGIDGKGALALWPLFGAVNQLLGGLALSVASVYIKQRKGHWFLITWIPAVLILTGTMWASIHNQIQFFVQRNGLLSVMNGIILVLAFVIIAECVIVIGQQKKENQ